LAPERVRLGEPLLVTGRTDERSTAQPHFGTEHPHERAAADARLADDGDDARDAAHHVVERLAQSREGLRPSNESLEVEAGRLARMGEGGIVASSLGLR